MDDLISKIQVLDTIENFGILDGYSDRVELMNRIADLPSIDAVPVVRCKDCIHRPKGTGANHDLEFPDYVCPCQCEDDYYSWMPKDDWFCKDGERKEE